MMNWKRILSDAAWAAVRACDAAFQAEFRAGPPPASDPPAPPPSSPEPEAATPVDLPLAPTPTGSDMLDLLDISFRAGRNRSTCWPGREDERYVRHIPQFTPVRRFPRSLHRPRRWPSQRRHSGWSRRCQS